MAKETANTQSIVELGIFTRRGARVEEKEESASHHCTIIFPVAQLRAEKLWNKPRGLQEKPEDSEI